jgi:hypothetical protein
MQATCFTQGYHFANFVSLASICKYEKTKKGEHAKPGEAAMQPF